MSTIENANEHLFQQNEIEKSIIQQLLVLEKEFRDYNSLIKTELAEQKNYIKRLSVLSQRYVLIVSTGECCKYPEIYRNPTQDCLLQELAEKIKLIRRSNCRLNNSLKNLRKSCIVFEQMYSQLDMTVESPIVLGNGHQPISFFNQLIGDLFKYYHAWILKLKLSAHLIEPSNFEFLNTYKELLEPSEDFDEYLNTSLTYCKCLQPKKYC